MSLATTAQELISRFTQDTRLLKLTTPIGAGRILAECVRVRADGRNGASGSQLDSKEVQAQIERATSCW